MARENDNEITIGGKETPNFNLKEAYAHFVAQTSSDEIDGRFDWTDSSLTELQDTFERSDFKTMIHKKGYDVSKQGRYFLTGIIVNNSPYFMGYEIVTEPTMFGRDVLDISVYGTGSVYVNERKERVGYRFWVDGNQTSNTFGRVFRTTGYVQNSEFIAFQKDDKNFSEFMYPKQFVNRVPGNLIRNNQLAIADLKRVEGMLDESAKLMEKIPAEYEFIKTLFATNPNYGTGKSGEQILQSVRDGGNTIEGGATGNGQYAGQISVFSSGGSTIEILLVTISTINDLAMKLSLTPRETTESGTNKMGSEIALFNQAPSVYMETKIGQRIIDISYFLKKFAPLFVPKFKPANDFTIVHLPSDYETGKKDKLQESKSKIDKTTADTKTSEANAKKHAAEEEKARAEANKANAEAEAIKNPAPVETTTIPTE